MWTSEYNDETDETTIEWNRDGFDAESDTISGQITTWRDGKWPDPDEESDASEAIFELIQSAGTPKRIRMQYDLNFGVKQALEDQS